jgi:hypothetical protein
MSLWFQKYNVSFDTNYYNIFRNVEIFKQKKKKKIKGQNVMKENIEI